MICGIRIYLVPMLVALGAIAHNIIAFAADIVLTVDLPDYVTWCTPVVLTDEAAKDEAAQQAARATAVTTMDKALLETKVRSSGIPFVGNVKQTKAKDKDGKDAEYISMDVCYVVDPAAAKPSDAAVKASTFSGERVATLVCARAAEGQCIERLQAALAKVTPAISPDTIKRWPWRYAATLEIPVGAPGVTAALTATDARPILGDAKVSEFGDLKRPDPKTMRPLRVAPTGSVITVPTEQGQWFVTAVTLPR